eukprot:UN34001
MDEREKKLLIQEVNIFKQLTHENIVRFRGTINDKHNRTFYLIQEYCNFKDLGYLIKDRAKKKKHLSERLVWRIFEQCLNALCYMHPKFLHRDLKPQNIMLSKGTGGQIIVKIGDFGLSRKLSTNTVYAQSRVGTPYYMSPEQILAQGYDDKADIWSLGCVLYELCSFQRPFTGNSIQQLTKAIKAGIIKPIQPCIYSRDLMSAIHSCLTTKIILRPNATELRTLIAPARKKLAFHEENFSRSEEIMALQKECAARKKRVDERKDIYRKKWQAVEKHISAVRQLTRKKRKHYLMNVGESLQNSTLPSVQVNKILSFINRIGTNRRSRIQSCNRTAHKISRTSSSHGSVSSS